MANEASRRLLLIACTFGCLIFIAVRALNVHVSQTVGCVLKGLPVLLLGLVAITADVDRSSDVSCRAKSYSSRISLGLVLSSFGDVALELPNGFVPGLGLFLLGHIAYLSAFQVGTAEGVRQRYRASGLWLSRLAILFWGSCVLVIHSFLSQYIEESLKLPVQIYVGTIAVMVYRAVARYDPICGNASYWYSAIGAIFFAISDFVLAVNKFVSPFPEARYLVMFLYYIGQVSLCSSTIVDENVTMFRIALSKKHEESKAKAKETKPNNKNKNNNKNNKKRKKK